MDPAPRSHKAWMWKAELWFFTNCLSFSQFWGRLLERRMNKWKEFFPFHCYMWGWFHKASYFALRAVWEQVSVQYLCFIMCILASVPFQIKVLFFLCFIFKCFFQDPVLFQLYVCYAYGSNHLVYICIFSMDNSVCTSFFYLHKWRIVFKMVNSIDFRWGDFRKWKHYHVPKFCFKLFSVGWHPIVWNWQSCSLFAWLKNK